MDESGLTTSAHNAPVLDPFRHRLARLSRLRALWRVAAGGSLAVTSLLWLLGGCLAVDLLFELDALQRVVLEVIAAGLLVWLLLTRVRRHLSRRESAAQLALALEQLYGIDTDLIAALEFTDAERSQSGSPILRSQVVQQAAARAEQLQFFRAVNWRGPARHLVVALASLLAALCVTWMYSDHVSTFLARLALSRRHYPSRTVLARITVNDQLVLAPSEGQSPRAARCGQQQPVTFSVLCTRAAPLEGELWIQDQVSHEQQRLPLRRPAGSPPSAAEPVLFRRAWLRY